MCLLIRMLAILLSKEDKSDSLSIPHRLASLRLMAIALSHKVLYDYPQLSDFLQS